MKKCLIIGSGIAGLTAASILSSKKIPVTVLESSPKFGGRTYSFKDSVSGETIDNGQHILMGCYDETLSFIKLIGAENNFLYQDNLCVKFLTNDKKEFSICASSLPYPVNLLVALLDYNIFDFIDKMRFIGFVLKLPFISKRSLQNLCVSDWLERENQNEKIIKSFWEILCVGALNTNPQKASAKIFYDVLIKIFFTGNFASTIILPKHGLSESIIDPAISFINKNGGSVIPSETIREFIFKDNKLVRINSDKNNYEDFDFVISAIPLHALQKIIPAELLNIKLNLSYSTILNIHIWVRENPVREKFYGLINSPLHWIFRHDKHLNIVISDADELSKKTNEEIIDMTMIELEKFTEIKKQLIDNYKIIREKRATFIPDKNIINDRPNSRTNINNLFLAGDWTNTGLPATIESAAKSGRIAAEMILSEINNLCYAHLIKTFEVF